MTLLCPYKNDKCQHRERVSERGIERRSAAVPL